MEVIFTKSCLSTPITEYIYPGTREIKQNNIINKNFNNNIAGTPKMLSSAVLTNNQQIEIIFRGFLRMEQGN